MINHKIKGPTPRKSSQTNSMMWQEIKTWKLKSAETNYKTTNKGTINHWFPLIRPALRAVFLGGGSFLGDLRFPWTTNKTKNGKVHTVDGSEILHDLIGSSSHYLQGFIHPRWLFRSSSINSRSSFFFNVSFRIQVWWATANWWSLIPVMMGYIEAIFIVTKLRGAKNDSWSH